MQRMKFPARQIRLISLLVAHHDCHPVGSADVKKLLSAVTADNFHMLLKIMEADTLAHSKWTVKKRLQNIQAIREEGERILRTGECYSLKGLAVDGKDLEEKGFSGKEIGEKLSFALQKVILGEWKNEKETILCELDKNNW